MKRLLAALFVLVLAVPAFAREGFGFSKKAVYVMRTVPPATNAGARRVRINVTSERGSDEDDARTLERYISDAILSGQGTLAESTKPDVIINVSLDRLDSHESWETKTEYVRQQTGTKQKWNESKKKYETEPIYSSVPVQKSYKVLTANLDGSFDIADKTRDVASGTLNSDFRETYGDNDSSPAPTEVEDNMLKKAARQVAAQIVPTQDRISVLVPRASFESLIPYAENGNWEQYLAAVEAVPPRKGAKDEAYRQYAMAVAKEALAYKSENRDEALEGLRAAKAHYETAVATNPGEELFAKGYTSLLASSNIGSPVARIAESVNRYTTWSGGGGGGPVRVASASKDTITTKSTTKTTSTSSPATKSGMRNQTVIDLARAGLSDENIILAIDAAERTDFDVSPEGLISLSKGGVSKGVIAHMQKRRK
jgi:hypothetical protein